MLKKMIKNDKNDKNVIDLIVSLNYIIIKI
jgi:hypothetical protein